MNPQVPAAAGRIGLRASQPASPASPGGAPAPFGVHVGSAVPVTRAWAELGTQPDPNADLLKGAPFGFSLFVPHPLLRVLSSASGVTSRTIHPQHNPSHQSRTMQQTRECDTHPRVPFGVYKREPHHCVTSGEERPTRRGRPHGGTEAAGDAPGSAQGRGWGPQSACLSGQGGASRSSTP